MEQGERHHEEIINRLEILAKQGDPEAIQELEQRNAELERDNKRAAKEHHAREVKWNSMNQKKDERIQTLEAQLDKQAAELGRKRLRKHRARALAEATIDAKAVHHVRRTFFSTKPWLVTWWVIGNDGLASYVVGGRERWNGVRWVSTSRSTSRS